jgi:hypothetical protein
VTIQYTGIGAGRDEWSGDTDDLVSVESVTHATEASILDWKLWTKLIAKTANYWEFVGLRALDTEDNVVINRTVSAIDGLLSAIRDIK